MQKKTIVFSLIPTHTLSPHMLYVPEKFTFHVMLLSLENRKQKAKKTLLLNRFFIFHLSV